MRLQLRLIYLPYLRRWNGFVRSWAYFPPALLANSFQNCWDAAQRGGTRGGSSDTRAGRARDTGTGSGRSAGQQPGAAGSAQPLARLHRRCPAPGAALGGCGAVPRAPGSGGAGPGPEQRPAGLPINCPAPGAAASRGVELRGGEKRHLSPQGRFEKSSGKRREGTERPRPPHRGRTRRPLRAALWGSRAAPQPEGRAQGRPRLPAAPCLPPAPAAALPSPLVPPPAAHLPSPLLPPHPSGVPGRALGGEGDGRTGQAAVGAAPLGPTHLCPPGLRLLRRGSGCPGHRGDGAGLGRTALRRLAARRCQSPRSPGGVAVGFPDRERGETIPRAGGLQLPACLASRPLAPAVGSWPRGA